jgi:hypothetical protein
MAVVTVSTTVQTTCHYWVSPKAIESTTGAGVELPAIVNGVVIPTAQGTPTPLSLSLDNTFTWNVSLDFRGAPPVYFEGFAPGAGGDLLTLLTAQGWVSL